MGTGNFFSKLFDFSFKEFLTLQIIKYLYILAVIGAGISALGILGTAFTLMGSNFGEGLLTLVLAPVAFVLLVLLARIVLEAIVATFRIAENTSILVEKGSQL